MEIPDNKPLKYALQYINGIGRSRAPQVLAELHLENKLAKDLTKREIVVLADEISKYMVGHELVISGSLHHISSHEFQICLQGLTGCLFFCVCVAE